MNIERITWNAGRHRARPAFALFAPMAADLSRFFARLDLERFAEYHGRSATKRERYFVREQAKRDASASLENIGRATIKRGYHGKG